MLPKSCHHYFWVYNCMPFLKNVFKTSPWWCPRETSNLYTLTLSLLVGYHSVHPSTPFCWRRRGIEPPTKFSERGDLTYRKEGVAFYKIWWEESTGGRIFLGEGGGGGGISKFLAGGGGTSPPFPPVVETQGIKDENFNMRVQ